MAMTKAQAALLTQEMMVRGIVETMARESSLMRRIPFDQVTGTAVVVNLEATMPLAHFYDVGDLWSENVGTVSQLTVPLRQLGGDVEIDDFLQRTYANPNDLEAALIEQKAKAVAHQFHVAFFDGDSTVDAKSFDGLEKLVRGTPAEMRLGTNGGNLSLDVMDQLVDLVKPGRPDAIFLSRRSRRRLKSLRRSSGIVVETGLDQFGQQVETYDGVPLLVDDFIQDSYTYGTAANCSRIYAVQFGHGRGVVGYENGGVTIEAIGPLETKNARRWRIKWYCAIANTRPGGVAMLSGVLG